MTKITEVTGKRIQFLKQELTRIRMIPLKGTRNLFFMALSKDDVIPLLMILLSAALKFAITMISQTQLDIRKNHCEKNTIGIPYVG